MLDAPDLAGNYDETSASAMFAYALLRAERLDLTSPEEASKIRASGQKAADALVDTRLVEENGEASLVGICQVAGLGPFNGRYRDGSPAYYLVEEVVADDAKGVGPFMMAYAEATLAIRAKAA
ncbi:24.9 kDa protein in picA locus [compost metagenome]